MQRTIRGFAAAALVGALALSAIDATPAQAAPAKQQKVGEAVTFDLSARRRHHRRYYHRRSFRFGYVRARSCWYYGNCYRYRHYRSPRRYYYHRHRHYYPRRGVYFYFRF